MKFFLLLLAVVWLGAMVYGQTKPLDRGLSVAGPSRSVQDVEFIHDLSYERQGLPVREQAIFARLCRLIDEAEHFVLLDMFLYNDLHDRQREYPGLSGMLTSRLIEKKAREPGVDIVLISDEINSHYGSAESVQFRRLRQNGVRVIITNSTGLRDSNPFYTALWRLFGQWFEPAGKGWLPSPFAPDGAKMTLRSYLRLFNFKANHRKVAASEQEVLVTSANPHDASAFHSNIAFVVRGNIVQDVVAAERAVAALSGDNLPSWPLPGGPEEGPVKVRFLSEGKIKARLLEELDRCGPGCSVDMAMFYLSQREVIDGLVAAAGRGAVVRLVLDPNRDAFGRVKNGIPNRPVARELIRRSAGAIAVRWYATRGEQFHSKLTIISRPGQSLLIGGSANLTRRNLDDLNLEACLEVEAPAGAGVARRAEEYFQRIWHNRDGIYSLDSQAFLEESSFQSALYRFQEWSGMSSF